MKAGFHAVDAALRNNPLGRCENLLQHEGVDEDHAVLEHVQPYKQLWTVEEWLDPRCTTARTATSSASIAL